MAAALLSELLDERLRESGGLGVAAAEVREVNDEVRLTPGEQRQQRVRTRQRSSAASAASLRTPGSSCSATKAARVRRTPCCVQWAWSSPWRAMTHSSTAAASRTRPPARRERLSCCRSGTPPASASGTAASDAPRTTASNAPSAGRWAAGGNDGQQRDRAGSAPRAASLQAAAETAR